jgi:transcriptional regulator
LIVLIEFSAFSGKTAAEQGEPSMLYVPPAFHQTDLAQIRADITAIGFATLITAGAQEPIISHVPLILRDDGSEFGVLIGHLARGNPQWNSSDLTKPAVAVFMGPHAYVSPSWYPSKLDNPRVVPTWNYAVVHVRGMLEVFEDSDQLLSDLTLLTEKHEQRVGSHWKTSDAPMDFMIRQTRGIVGIRLKIQALDAKSKLSQNRAAADAFNVQATLEKSEVSSDRDVAAAMARVPKL